MVTLSIPISHRLFLWIISISFSILAIYGFSTLSENMSLLNFVVSGVFAAFALVVWIWKIVCWSEDGKLKIKFRGDKK